MTHVKRTTTLHHTLPHPTDSATGPNRSLSVENGEEGELEMELPPPMKVMEQPMSAAAAQGTQGTAAAAAGPPLPPLDNILTDVPSRVSFDPFAVLLSHSREIFPYFLCQLLEATPVLLTSHFLYHNHIFYR